MILTSRDGSSLTLSPVAYEFPVLPVPSSPSPQPSPATICWDEESDPDWLMIRGDARTPDGQSWVFIEPCLRTWEARQLGEWLGQVAAHDVNPEAPGDKEAALLEFTEPNLAFVLESRHGQEVRLRVQLSAEALPPWKFRAGGPDLFDQFLTFDLSDDDVRAAQEEWVVELRDFPDR